MLTTPQQTHQQTRIDCTSKLFRIGKKIILQLPPEASTQLPSRGQTMVEGSVQGVHFVTPLEPDGNGSHWFSPNAALLNAARIGPGDTVTMTISPTKAWIEPDVPADLAAALAAHPRAQGLWQRITPMARWEWVRWSRSTNNPETRQRRIAVACSKLEAGERRPCCWNRNLCTDPTVSKNGVLTNPAATAPERATL